jgi:hypothetical protein
MLIFVFLVGTEWGERATKQVARPFKKENGSRAYSRALGSDRGDSRTIASSCSPDPSSEIDFDANKVLGFGLCRDEVFRASGARTLARRQLRRQAAHPRHMALSSLS